MGSNAQKRKEQKKVARKKRLTKERNVRANGARFRFTLECRLSKNQPWKPMKRFRDRAEVQAHIDETEALREKGEVDIIEGRIIDNNVGLGRVIATIPASAAKAGPSMLEAARDKLGKAIADRDSEAETKINEENFEKSVRNVSEDAV